MERAKRTTFRIHVLSHSPMWQKSSLSGRAFPLKQLLPEGKKFSLHWEPFCLTLWTLSLPNGALQPEAHLVTEINNKQEGRGGSQGALSLCSSAFGPWAREANFNVQLPPLNMHPAPAKAATSCGSLIPLNRVLRASHKQCLALVCTRDPLKKLKTSKPRSQLQTAE